MKARMFYKDILTDEKIAKLSDREYRIWTGLLLVANDYGCFRESYFAIQLKMPAFQASEKEIKDTMNKLVEIGIGDRYIYEGDKFFYFLQWERYQRTRCTRSKIFPEPLHPMALSANREYLGETNYFDLYPEIKDTQKHTNKGKTSPESGSYTKSEEELFSGKDKGEETQNKEPVKTGIGALSAQDQKLLREFKKHWDDAGLPRYRSVESITMCGITRLKKPIYRGILDLIKKHKDWRNGYWRYMLLALRRDPYYEENRTCTIAYVLRNVDGGLRENSPRNLTQVALGYAVEIEKEKRKEHIGNISKELIERGYGKKERDAVKQRVLNYKLWQELTTKEVETWIQKTKKEGK